LAAVPTFSSLADRTKGLVRTSSDALAEAFGVAIGDFPFSRSSLTAAERIQIGLGSLRPHGGGAVVVGITFSLAISGILGATDGSIGIA